MEREWLQSGNLNLFKKRYNADRGDRRQDDSFGAGFYYNGISRPLKNDIERLTGGSASVKNEKGTEIFYDFAITPAIKLIPGYQHIGTRSLLKSRETIAGQMYSTFV